jgi:hypothetical protein
MVISRFMNVNWIGGENIVDPKACMQRSSTSRMWSDEQPMRGMDSKIAYLMRRTGDPMDGSGGPPRRYADAVLSEHLRAAMVV